ncbi:uncharacterized protein LOC132926135 [Rhopalosiphum padi]|uniref:uncharacterized protein LOC132926135 n=1 Tax=Rhopalosiphum padi TaxID=40932 RepID=UPI00298DAD04|nr:uncharacterized protein LOC132926135 [Rhopalosiphum padi]
MDNLNIGSINNCPGLRVNYYGNSNPSVIPANPRPRQAVRRCFNCNGYGHIARKCKKSKKKYKRPAAAGIGSSERPERVAPGAAENPESTAETPGTSEVAPGAAAEAPGAAAEAAEKKNMRRV